MRKEHNLTNMRFGKLIALERTTPNEMGQKQWKCVCDCGLERIARESALVSGKLISCGNHGHAKNIAGKKFGRLTVLKFVGLDKNRQAKWMCMCDCGSIKITTCNSLTSGNTKSCGCYAIESLIERVQKPFCVASFNHLYQVYRKRASERKLEFSLTKEEFRNIVGKTCHYCGCAPTQQQARKHNGNIVYNGIDRVDNTKGYTLDNVVPCCGVCNAAKSDRTLEEFENWINRVYTQFHSLQRT